MWSYLKYALDGDGFKGCIKTLQMYEGSELLFKVAFGPQGARPFETAAYNRREDVSIFLNEGSGSEITLSYFPGSCGLVVFSGLDTYDTLFLDRLLPFAEALASYAGYTRAILTDISGWAKYAERGWLEGLPEFVNRRTSNHIKTFYKDLMRMHEARKIILPMLEAARREVQNV